MKKYFQIIAVIFVLALVALFAVSLQISGAGQLQSGPAPDFTFKQFDGKQFKLSDMRGKVVVLNIWASWCEPCKDEAAILESGWRTYKDKGVMFLGVDYVDTEERALAFVKQFNVTYPNGPDLGSTIYRKFRARGVPETYIIDRLGAITRVFIGPVNGTELKNTLDDLVAKVSR